jgi:hypothetical protein
MPQHHGLMHVAQQIMLHHQAELEAAKKIMESISGQVTFILSSQNIFPSSVSRVLKIKVMEIQCQKRCQNWGH